MFKVNESCPDCGLKIEKGDGAFLGPFVINYSLTTFGFVIPIVLLHVVFGKELGGHGHNGAGARFGTPADFL